MSDKQMVSVPSTTPEGMVRSINALLALDARGSLVPHGVGGLARDLLTKCAEVLSRPAEQHHGEPVDLNSLRATGISQVATGWNKCIDRLQNQFGHLYTHADPAEVERLRAELAETQRISQEEEQRANRYSQQLAERDALLRVHTDHIATLCDVMFRHGLGMEKEAEQKIYAALKQQQVVFAALSASAEPSNDLCAEGAHEFVPFSGECVKCGEPYSAEPSAPAWSCQSCQLEQPTDRPCDVCGGKTEPVATKS